MDDDLGIAVRVETVPTHLEFAAEFREVVDFFVEDDPDASVLVVDRLLPAGHINAAEPAHPEPYRALRVDPFIVGATVDDRLTHPLDVGGFDDCTPLTGDTRYSTHWPISFSS